MKTVICISVVTVIGTLLGCCTRSGLASTITIQDPGFEAPGGYYQYPTGWVCDDYCWEYAYSGLGGALPSPDGSTWGAYTESSWVRGVGGFTQVVAGLSIAPNTQYTLEVLVGGRSDSYSFGGSLIELYDEAAGTVLASQEWDVNTPGQPNGGWVTSSASFTTGATGDPIGHELAVRLLGLDEGPQTWFDDVSLDATTVATVPEPSTFALLGAGAIGLMGWAWRRRRAKA